MGDTGELAEEERSLEPLLVVPLRRSFAVGMKWLVGGVVAFGGMTLAVAILVFVSVVRPPENATPAETLVAGLFFFVMTLSVWWGARGNLDLVVTRQGLSIPGRKISLRWEELKDLEWDEEKRTLWAVRSDARAWYRRTRVPLIADSLYDFTTNDRERLRSLWTEHRGRGGGAYGIRE